MTWIGRLVLACTVLGASVAEAQTSYYQPVARLVSSQPVARAGFGLSIAADGQWAVIGEPQAKNAAGQTVGMIHVARLHDGTAELVATLASPEPAPGQRFGDVVDISGETIVVGTSALACDAGRACGAVYVFVLRDGSWVFDARVDSPAPARNDNFGLALDLDGDTLVVQSRGDRPGVVRRAGIIDVFVREEGLFHATQALQPAGIPASARFGETLALSGDTLLARARNDVLDGQNVNSVYVMLRGAEGFVQDARLARPQASGFGSMLAIQNDLSFVVAASDTDDAREGTGSLRTFARLEHELRELPKVVDPAPQRENIFGTSLVVQADRLWVGSVDTTVDRYDFGAVQVFGLLDGHATWLEELRAPGATSEDQFGSRLAVSGRYVLAGAHDDSSLAERAGAVHVFYDSRADAGEACSEDAGCLDGHCIDGMCCATECDTRGGCTACRAALTGASDGTCAPVVAGTACGSELATTCSAPDTCDGAGTCLDHHAADGTACEDGLFCSAADACQAGQCVTGTAAACPEDLACVEDEAVCRSVCGDGVLQRDEACDDGAANSDTEANTCRTSCQLPRCGDGVVDTAEGCDQGSENSDARMGACRTDCSPARCGDGVVDDVEQCDEGARNSDALADACRTTCVRAACGDAVVDQGEGCDEGAVNSDVQPDHCRKSCQPAGCGDGVVDQGEACDEGAPSDTCSITCTLPACSGVDCGDAGVPEEDAGREADAGSGDGSGAGVDHDAGSAPHEPGDGCSVSRRASPAWTAPLSFAIALLVLRRRRTRT